MCAAQLDELLSDTNPPSSNNECNLVPALIAIILAPALTVGMMYLVIEMNKPEDAVSPDEVDKVQLIWNLRRREVLRA